MSTILQEWKREIETDLARFLEDFNRPELREYVFGDSSGTTKTVTAWLLACPECLYRGEVNTAEKPVCPNCGVQMNEYSLRARTH